MEKKGFRPTFCSISETIFRKDISSDFEIQIEHPGQKEIVSAHRANTNLAYTVQKIEHRHSIGGLALKTFTQQAGVIKPIQDPRQKEIFSGVLKSVLFQMTGHLDWSS